MEGLSLEVGRNSPSEKHRQRAESRNSSCDMPSRLNEEGEKLVQYFMQPVTCIAKLSAVNGNFIVISLDNYGILVLDKSYRISYHRVTKDPVIGIVEQANTFLTFSKTYFDVWAFSRRKLKRMTRVFTGFD